MKKLFAVIFAWTLFSTQAFAQTAAENEKVAQLQKMIDSHLADLEDIDTQEVQAFFAGNNLSPEKLEEAISQLENMNLEDARELATYLGIEEELSQITEEEWQQHKNELMVTLKNDYEDSPRYKAYINEGWGGLAARFIVALAIACLAAAIGGSGVLLTLKIGIGLILGMLVISLLIYLALNPNNINKFLGKKMGTSNDISLPLLY